MYCPRCFELTRVIDYGATTKQCLSCKHIDEDQNFIPKDKAMKIKMIGNCTFELWPGDYVVRCPHCGETVQVNRRDEMDECYECEKNLILRTCEVLD